MTGQISRIEPTPEDLAILKHHVLRLTELDRKIARTSTAGVHADRFFRAVRNATMDYIEFPGLRPLATYPEDWNC